MAHDKVYGICENKCMVEVYSKEKVDRELDNYIPSDNIAVLKGDVQFYGSKLFVKFPYPNGFTKNNCFILSLQVDGQIQNRLYYARLDDDGVTLLQQTASATGASYVIALMKL